MRLISNLAIYQKLFTIQLSSSHQWCRNHFYCSKNPPYILYNFNSSPGGCCLQHGQRVGHETNLPNLESLFLQDNFCWHPLHQANCFNCSVFDCHLICHLLQYKAPALRHHHSSCWGILYNTPCGKTLTSLFWIGRNGLDLLYRICCDKSNLHGNVLVL